jgi:hypothetical protein
MTVEVNVTIDKTGRVIQAEAIPPRNLNHSLSHSAVNASMLWKFGRPCAITSPSRSSRSWSSSSNRDRHVVTCPGCIAQS